MLRTRTLNAAPLFPSHGEPMKITSTNSVGAGAVRRKNGTGRGKPTEERFSIESGVEDNAPAIGGVSPIGSVDSLLAIQEVSAVTGEHERSTARGHRLLDRLNEIWLGLLQGGIPRDSLVRLAKEIDAARGQVSDPRLAVILDEIDLRARVELAKYNEAA